MNKSKFDRDWLTCDTSSGTVYIRYDQIIDFSDEERTIDGVAHKGTLIRTMMWRVWALQDSAWVAQQFMDNYYAGPSGDRPGPRDPISEAEIAAHEELFGCTAPMKKYPFGMESRAKVASTAEFMDILEEEINP